MTVHPVSEQRFERVVALQAGSLEERQLLNELLAEGVHRRQEKIAEERFHALGLAELLLAESERFQKAQARGLLSFECSPALAARCGLGLAICLAALGHGAQARRLRKESRPLGDSVADGRDLLELDWLEGRLATRLGEEEEAIARLSSVRQRLLQRKRLLDAALCSLDLARVFAETSQEERIGGLIDELYRVFPVSLDQVRMLIALHDFQRSAQSGADLEDAAREAIELIRRPAAILKKL